VPRRHGDDRDATVPSLGLLLRRICNKGVAGIGVGIGIGIGAKCCRLNRGLDKSLDIHRGRGRGFDLSNLSNLWGLHDFHGLRGLRSGFRPLVGFGRGLNLLDWLGGNG
jgi:hypothetical protein